MWPVQYPAVESSQSTVILPLVRHHQCIFNARNNLYEFSYQNNSVYIKVLTSNLIQYSQIKLWVLIVKGRGMQTRNTLKFAFLFPSIISIKFSYFLNILNVPLIPTKALSLLFQTVFFKYHMKIISQTRNGMVSHFKRAGSSLKLPLQSATV